MSASDIILTLFKVLGGLSLFLYGMNGMTGNLRQAAGSSLRDILAKATRSPAHGVAFGVFVGFLAHSGAAISMLAGFINAGVMTLFQSLAPVFGANIGTSLSSQVISFNITQYCWIAVGLGFLARSLVRSERWSKLGDAALGFGLLFLGMGTISAAIAPYKEQLAPLLASIRGDVWTWRLAGIAAATLFTALLTSSGAMIGLAFALVNAGVLTRFDQLAVIILGAMVGTCIVPVMAALPMRISAKRAAAAHVLFNVVNVLLALAAWPWLVRFCEWSAPASLVRQGANLHVLLMTAGTLVVLPFSRLFLRLVLACTPSSESDPEPSFLEERLLVTPEAAIAATIRELQRMANLCVECMMICGHLIVAPTPKLHRRLRANEEILNQVRLSMYAYLRRLTRHHLSSRQVLFLQNIHRCMKDVERIGDHIAHIAETSIERYANDDAILPESLFRVWFNLFCSAKKVVVLMAKSFDPDNPSFQNTALGILKARDAYFIQSLDAKADFAGADMDHAISPIASYYISRCIENLDRLVRRAKSVALAERQPAFMIKSAKFDKRVVDRAPPPRSPRVAPESYLRLLTRESPFADEDDLADPDGPTDPPPPDASAPQPPAPPSHPTEVDEIDADDPPDDPRPPAP